MVTGSVLKDRFFYPLALIVIAAIIVLALLPGGESDAGVSPVWEMSGEDLQALQVSPGTEMSYLEREGGYVALSAITPFDVGPSSIGIFAALGPAQERNFAGSEVEITLRARAARTNSLDAFDSGYFPLEGKPSAWSTFQLTENWQDFSYRFTPPVIAAEPNADLLAIFPGKAGERKVMELSMIRVAKTEVVDAP